LSDYNSTLVAKGPKQQDTTTKYTKQIQTALQFKDLGDARQYYSDAYFAAYGKYPEAELDKKFQDSWNANVVIKIGLPLQKLRQNLLLFMIRRASLLWIKQQVSRRKTSLAT
jgi:hypothetical protein